MDSPVHHADIPQPTLTPTPAPDPILTPAPAIVTESPPIQREHDSIDDFEHLDRDASPPRDNKPPLQPASIEADLLNLGGKSSPIAPPQKDPVSSVQSFLDTEREEMLIAPTHVTPSAPPQHQEEPQFSDSREELSPAPSEDSLPDAIENFASPPSPAKVPISNPPPSAPVEEPTIQEDRPPPIPERPAHTLPQSVPQKQQPGRPVTEAEVIFCQMGLDAWFNPERLHPKVESLVYWRSPAKSGIALGGGLVLLLALACCSLISVLAYTSLLILSATTAFRVYSSVLQAVQKTTDGHPFKEFLETDLSISQERSQELAVLATAHINAAVNELRRLFLVEDLVDSLKFGVTLWCLTYLGAWFNGMTLLIIGYVALFTLPKVYETNKAQIDANLDLVSARFQEITNKVKAAIPIGKKGESDKDK